MGLLGAHVAAPAVITTPGLLMPVKKILRPDVGGLEMLMQAGMDVERAMMQSLTRGTCWSRRDIIPADGRWENCYNKIWVVRETPIDPSMVYL